MNKERLSDFDLVRSYQQGHDASFAVLVERYKRPVYSTIFFIVNNKEVAEDIFQETFIKASRYLREQNYMEMGKVSGWLISIARNYAIDYYRKNRRQPQFFEAQDNDAMIHKNLMQSAMPVAAIEQKELARTVRQLIRLLPEEQREVLILRHYADMSFKDIAASMNSNLSTTLGRMRYALINLRKMIVENKVEV
jgi:RNA polymerase sigma factor (sigma-70 family)